ncbi:DMT family transporter [Paracoccus shanxieyensis]|uniref:EamA family transporter n=1 Tax=Paracoccus shanxieyensis TaxID=2675752 RepID=A0A6L6IX38_9RHOB|nr:DMT family transporter [Paracoccus shanxieyensis]MTH64439.1 EamA family transporter [Paracoccus shanxieyensis]MTH87568.1 EamA family transporter [Paracoccus shanxieyensis]
MGSENFRAALLMIASMVFFAFEDMFIKLLTAQMPYAQVLGLIGVIGGLSFWAVLRLRGGRLFTRDLCNPALVLRNLGEALGSVLFVSALALGELAPTAAIMQALPLVIVMGAALFLGEPVGWRRWSAIGAGFFGVLLVIRPGIDGFSATSLLALLAVLCFAARDIVTRRVPAHVHSLQLSASAFLGLALVSIPMALVLGQRPVLPDAWQWLQVAGCLTVGVLGYGLLVSATRLGEASALAPYRYVRLVFALVLALIVFHERPDTLTLLGAAVIVASGAYAMWREALLRRRIRRAAGLIA